MVIVRLGSLKSRIFDDALTGFLHDCELATQVPQRTLKLVRRMVRGFK